MAGDPGDQRRRYGYRVSIDWPDTRSPRARSRADEVPGRDRAAPALTRRWHDGLRVERRRRNAVSAAQRVQPTKSRGAEAGLSRAGRAPRVGQSIPSQLCARRGKVSHASKQHARIAPGRGVYRARHQHTPTGVSTASPRAATANFAAVIPAAAAILAAGGDPGAASRTGPAAAAAIARGRGATDRAASVAGPERGRRPA